MHSFKATQNWNFPKMKFLAWKVTLDVFAWSLSYNLIIFFSTLNKLDDVLMFIMIGFRAYRYLAKEILWWSLNKIVYCSLNYLRAFSREHYNETSKCFRTHRVMFHFKGQLVINDIFRLLNVVLWMQPRSTLFFILVNSTQWKIIICL